MSKKVQQDASGHFVSKEGRPAPLRERAPRIRRRPPTKRHYRVDALLTDAQRVEYEKLLAHPNTTAQTLHEFLLARGHRVCKGAVQNHRRSWNAELKRLREVATIAGSFCEVARAKGPGALAEASHARFEMMLVESLFKNKGARKLPLAQWQSLAKTLQGVVATRRSVEEMRAAFEARAVAAAEAAERAAKSGATTHDVVARVRDLLGV